MKLFEPGKVGEMVTKNRIVMSPMATGGLADPDGSFSERQIEYYATRAQGGAGLVMTGATFVNSSLESGYLQYSNLLESEKHAGRLAELCRAMHLHGVKIAIQLSPGVGRVNFTRNNPIHPVSASAVPCFWDPKVTTRELGAEEIDLLVRSYGVSAGMARAAGVDAIEVHGYGGYLVDQFQTTLWNKRNDKYGGDLNGRLRFSLELIEAARSAVGRKFPIIYRLTPDHYMEGGRRIEEGVEMARRLEAAGVDALHIVGGCYEVWYRAIPCTYEPIAGNVRLAEAVKSVVEIPVIVDGSLGQPEVAEKVLEAGKADFIGLGRSLVADPEWPLKVREGRIDDIRPCIRDQEGCLGGGSGEGFSCTVNPATGREREYLPMPAERRKTVLVIGGGPGGLEAARVAALRGHQVSLWERNSRLGGDLIPASVPDFKQDTRRLVDYLSNQVKKLGVLTELTKEATAELVQQSSPDAVILATGANPLIPDIPGTERDNVVTAVDVLMGNREIGESVVVAGGGLVGCETAVYLAKGGKKVAIIEMMGRLVPQGMNLNSRMGLLNLVEQNGVEVLTGSKLLEITKGGVLVEADGLEREMKADSVVLALGLKPESGLRIDLEGKVPELFVVGDCVEPRKILNAIWEGFHAACSV
ncbi:FAD-dependent oxidoreductase [Chloroflexota bacterium]